MTGQPGWVSLDKTERTGLPGHDSGIKRAVDKGVWAEQLEKDSWDRTAGRGWLDRTAGRRWPDRTAGRGWPGQDSRAGQLV